MGIVSREKNLHIQGSRLTINGMGKRKSCKLLLDCLTWCCRSDALCKQTTEEGFFRMVNDMNGRAECCVDWECIRVNMVKNSRKEMKAIPGR
jgi:hypothetical protein